MRELITLQVDELVIGEPIAMELIGRPTDPPALHRIEQLTDGLPSLDVEPADFRAAAAPHRLAPTARR